MPRFLSLVPVAAVFLVAALGLAPVAAAEDGERALGSPDAPITVIEYASLTCPHCATFHVEMLPEIKERYIDTGEVRLVFRDFPLDRLALAGSMLARCAPPDRYFAFLDLLFDKQEQWATAADPVEELAKVARMGGLSRDKFEACLSDEELRDEVIMTRMVGEREHDITGTPTFVVDGRLYNSQELKRLLADRAS